MCITMSSRSWIAKTIWLPFWQRLSCQRNKFVCHPSKYVWLDCLCKKKKIESRLIVLVALVDHMIEYFIFISYLNSVFNLFFLWEKRCTYKINNFFSKYAS
jgi:hypothetical protein